MIVADASAVIDALAKPTARDLKSRLQRAAIIHAPHLVDVEVTSGLRRLVAAGALSPDRAADARADAMALPLRRYPHGHLLTRAWELRDDATIYDGVYIALAELLGYPLVTTDARLAQVPGHAAQIEVFAV